MEISIQMFRTWQKDPVTVAMMEMLKIGVKHTTEEMLNPDNIEEKDSRAEMHRRLGYMEGLQEIINIHITTEEDTNENGTNRV